MINSTYGNHFVALKILYKMLYLCKYSKRLTDEKITFSLLECTEFLFTSPKIDYYLIVIFEYRSINVKIISIIIKLINLEILLWKTNKKNKIKVK